MTVHRLQRALVALGLIAALTSGCALSLTKPASAPGLNTAPAGAAIPTATMLPKAQSVFTVTLPEPLASGEVVALALLDEVTGLPFSSELYPMRALDALTFTATLALPHQAVVKYRYMRLGAAQVIEDTALDWPVRYRLFVASAPAEVRDVVASWSDRAASSATGSIQGRVLNSDTGAPIPDIMVACAGQRAFTDSGGRFDIQGLAPGTHNIVAYAIDGTYGPFQQGATVAAGLNTAVDVKLKAAPLVRVTFMVTAPNDIPGTPIRIAGNLVELGNTFADLQGGMSTVAERMPVMALQPDGRYSATLTLPVGAYLQYKYTLGDGFWNAEHGPGGEFKLRDLIVPDRDVTIQDAVSAWSSGSAAPILFDVTVASNTPASDLISIQFNALGWTEPIPMWPMGGGRWLYKLYGPLDTATTLHYRYCRAGQCGSTDDLATAGLDAQGRAVETNLSPQDIQESVGEWAWLGETEPSALVGTNITPRPAGFVAGVEFQAGYRPNWSYYNPQAIQGVQGLGAGWLIFTPGWSFAAASPLAFGMDPRVNPSWLDSTIMISQARATNLNVAIFPVPTFDPSADEFWSEATRDPAWWQNWFEHYRAFAVHHADLAASTGSQALILGGDAVAPALPGGLLKDGSESGAPQDAAARWRAILTEVRQHFGGEIWWALPYAPGSVQSDLGFVTTADRLYLLWSAPLAADNAAPEADLRAQAEQLLDGEVAPLAALTGKPVVLALAYPSALGVKTGCFLEAGSCFDWEALSQPHNPGGISVDLQAQADMYEAVLNAVNTRAFVGGVVSRGFYPPTLLQDKSASVHGKPAADLLWYWFPRLTGSVQ